MSMMSFTGLACVPTDHKAPSAGRLRLAVAACPARFKGSSREHTESGLRCYLAWCAERGLNPLAAQRPHLELCIRWMQEIRRFKPSTVSRRFPVVAGFYRTCVLDSVLEHSPAELTRQIGQLLGQLRTGQVSAEGHAGQHGQPEENDLDRTPAPHRAGDTA
jgi:hypothetical protein